LKRLMGIAELKDFYLVGGTVLALRYGHRKPIDVDLFVSEDSNNEQIAKVLEKTFPAFLYRRLNNPIGLFGYIDDVKVDLVKHHRILWLKPCIEWDGTRISCDEDIIGMKINAILRRADKKNFWDSSEFLHHYKLSDCIGFYHQKFSDQRLEISIPTAITYFDDAEDSEDPVSLQDQTWGSMKKHLQKQVRDYLA